ncbi:MAG: ATPase domain-containing protein, partial [Xanthobacteraceae bacterium]
MAKARTSFVCQACGAVSPRWQGKCESCGAWNTILEETAAAAAVPAAQRSSRKGRSIRLEPLSGTSEEAPRIASGIAEFDRVVGGGFVRGSVLLLGGDPGIGKSTLLIEVAAKLAGAGRRVIYVSGEEAIGQI